MYCNASLVCKGAKCRGDAVAGRVGGKQTERTGIQYFQRYGQTAKCGNSILVSKILRYLNVGNLSLIDLFSSRTY
jgi:hypothetical protein